VVPGGARWCQVVLGGARWCQVVLGAAKFLSAEQKDKYRI
jgi:hypothetical protein